MKRPEACLFDLDGVIVDTAKYHFLAWRQIADQLGFRFTEHDNERLKGVSRQRSLDILLEIGGVAFDDAAKAALAEKKNNLYLEYIRKMTSDEILPGAAAFLRDCRAAGLKTALATASRNSALILDRLGIRALFDVVVDGNEVSHTKPHPEVFLKCAQKLGIDPQLCVVFEDAVAGIEAAAVGGMFSVGVGDPAILTRADMVISGLAAFSVGEMLARFEQEKQKKQKQ